MSEMPGETGGGDDDLTQAWKMSHDLRVHPVDCPARPEGQPNCNTEEHAQLTQWVKEFREEREQST